MQPANNLAELAGNLITSRQLDEPDFYVPLYEEVLDGLREELLQLGQQEATYFIIGQSGNGKTTALRFFRQEGIDERYQVAYINGRELFSAEDVDIIDLLLMFCSELIRERPSLRKQYAEKIEEYALAYAGEIEIAINREEVSEDEILVEGGLSLSNLLSILGLKAGLSSKIKTAESSRRVIREIFKPRLDKVLADLNEIILAIGKEKPLLLIVDDLEKLKRIEQVRSLFVENAHIFKHIQCPKVITIPSHFQFDSEIEAEFRYFWTAIRPNPLHPEDENARSGAERKRSLFRALIHNRIAAGVELITNNAVEQAINFSAGNPRQFVEILYRSCVHARKFQGTKITVNDINYAVSEIGRSRTGTELLMPKIKLLYHVQKTFLPPLDEDIELIFDALSSNQIFFYHDDVPWYEVDPIIANTVGRYGKIYS